MRTRIRYTPARLVCLALALVALAGLGARRAAAVPYPNTSGTPFTVRLRFEYPQLIGAGTPSQPSNGYFKFANGSPDWAGGGWIRLDLTADTPSPNSLQLTANDVGVNFELSEASVFYNGVPSSLRSKIHTQITMTQSPFFPAPVAITPHVRQSTYTVAGLEGFASNFSTSRSAAWSETTQAQWVDQTIRLRVEVWLDGSVADPLMTGTGRYSREYLLYTFKNAHRQVSPYLLPLTIVGQPPGNLSWSRMTIESKAGAGIAINHSQSSSVTTRNTIGIGPINFSDPDVTISRSSGTGLAQTHTAWQALNLYSHNPVHGPAPYGPGQGDVLFCLVRPTYTLTEAPVDMDFQYLTANGPATPSYFPMYELLFPQRGTPPGNLSAAENGAFRALNPLLADPRAQLNSPRFYRVLGPVSGTAGALGGAYGMQNVTRQEVNSAVGSSTTTNSSTGFTLPLGAIGSAIGAGFPIPDVSVRQQETTTTSVEYQTTDLLENSNTILTEFQFSDSDPRKWLFIEVYYDTVFRCFLFRDASMAPIQWGQFRAQVRLDETRLGRWLAIRRGDAGAEGRFAVAGSLAGHAPRGGYAIIRGEKGPAAHAVLAPETGNVVLPALEPGTYRVYLKAPALGPAATAGTGPYALTLSREGEVTFR